MLLALLVSKFQMADGVTCAAGLDCWPSFLLCELYYFAIYFHDFVMDEFECLYLLQKKRIRNNIPCNFFLFHFVQFFSHFSFP